MLFPEQEPRRLKLLSIEPDLLKGLLSLDGTKAFTIKGMPEDARIVGATFDNDYQRITLLVESKTFSTVSGGLHVGKLELTIMYRNLAPVATPAGR